MSRKNFLQPETLTGLAESFRQLAFHVPEPEHELLIHARASNAWFEPDQVRRALKAWVRALEGKKAENWIRQEGPFNSSDSPKNIGLILAGNIPLAGLHDLLCVLVAGQRAIVKPSSKDELLIRYTAETLVKLQPDLQNSIVFTGSRLNKTDAVIATGSDNSNRYFDYYFRNIPHIFRKNRTGVAVLTGNESSQDLEGLCHDLLDYFGLGCRNVSHVLVPENYSFIELFNQLYAFRQVLNNNKYANNYEYNRTLYLLNNEDILDNNFFLIKRSNALFSPVSVLHYSFYSNAAQKDAWIEANRDSIQTIAGKSAPYLPFGTLQQPELNDYADGVNTFSFIKSVV